MSDGKGALVGRRGYTWIGRPAELHVVAIVESLRRRCEHLADAA
jgi:hypothetical protein